MAPSRMRVRTGRAQRSPRAVASRCRRVRLQDAGVRCWSLSKSSTRVKASRRLAPTAASKSSAGTRDWLIYSAPISASISGCGGWGLDVIDATTGRVESEGWSPGP
jgi:hypothetical protein